MAKREGLRERVGALLTNPSLMAHTGPNLLLLLPVMACLGLIALPQHAHLMRAPYIANQCRDLLR